MYAIKNESGFYWNETNQVFGTIQTAEQYNSLEALPDSIVGTHYDSNDITMVKEIFSLPIDNFLNIQYLPENKNYPLARVVEI